MKSLVFDTGSIISLALNNLLWLLEPLKIQFDGGFIISPAVKQELVDKPLQTKKYKFEALQVLQNIQQGVLEIIDTKHIQQTADRLYQLANSCFIADNHPISIVHNGEIEGIAAYLHLNSNAFIIDERTTRLLIEEPKKLAYILQHKLHTPVTIHHHNLNQFLHEVKNIKLLRSFELAVMAYELGLLDKFLPNLPSPKKMLLDGVLWGIKLNGCAVSEHEIDEVIRLEH